MKYLFILIVIYLVFKSLAKMVGSLKIMDPQNTDVDQSKTEVQNKLHVNEDDIEDADFKDVE